MLILKCDWCDEDLGKAYVGAEPYAPFSASRGYPARHPGTFCTSSCAVMWLAHTGAGISVMSRDDMVTLTLKDKSWRTND